MRVRFLTGYVSCLLVGLIGTPALAEESTSGDQSASTGWEFSITPYLWAAGEKGDIQAFAVAPPVDVDLTFSDIFDHLDFAAMGVIQARNDRFVAMADIAYVKVSASKGVGVRDPDFVDVDLETSTFTATLLGGYRAVDQGPMFLDVMGGARISSAKTKLSLTGPVRSLSGSSSETWVDPVIATRFHAPLSDRWAVILYGDIGGFGMSSDLTWQLQGAVQYRLSRSWSLEAGWRQYAVDYDTDGFLYDVKLGGPLFGATYRF